MALVTKPNIMDADGFYAKLLASHRGLTDAQSHALNARLVLILANHVGTLRHSMRLWPWPATGPNGLGRQG